MFTISCILFKQIFNYFYENMNSHVYLRATNSSCGLFTFISTLRIIWQDARDWIAINKNFKNIKPARFERRPIKIFSNSFSEISEIQNLANNFAQPQKFPQSRTVRDSMQNLTKTFQTPIPNSSKECRMGKFRRNFPERETKRKHNCPNEDH